MGEVAMQPNRPTPQKTLYRGSLRRGEMFRSSGLGAHLRSYNLCKGMGPGL